MDMKNNLEKVMLGENIREILVGFGWTAYARQKGILGRIRGRQQVAADCDGAAFLCGADGYVISEDLQKCCIYYNNTSLYDRAILHMGDNLSGEGDGDDEIIRIRLSQMPAEVTKIILVLNMFKDEPDRNSFRDLEDVFIRLTDAKNGEEICKVNLPEDQIDSNAVAGGVLERTRRGWTFSGSYEQMTRAASLEDLAAAFSKPVEIRD